MLQNKIPELGQRLRKARRSRFPRDGIRGFCVRVGVSPTTLVKMEKGDLSVSMGSYYRAAYVLQLEEQFDGLFDRPEALFED